VEDPTADRLDNDAQPMGVFQPGQELKLATLLTAVLAIFLHSIITILLKYLILPLMLDTIRTHYYGHKLFLIITVLDRKCFPRQPVVIFDGFSWNLDPQHKIGF